jgi:hypothetical protein
VLNCKLQMPLLKVFLTVDPRHYQKASLQFSSSEVAYIGSNNSDNNSPYCRCRRFRLVDRRTAPVIDDRISHPVDRRIAPVSHSSLLLLLLSPHDTALTTVRDGIDTPYDTALTIDDRRVLADVWHSADTAAGGSTA